MMRVRMELETGELLLCCICGELFHGDAVLNIDVGDESVEAAYCTPCAIQSSSTKAKNE